MKLRPGLMATTAAFCIAALCVSCKKSETLWDPPAPDVLAENPTWTPDGARVLYECHGRVRSVDMNGNITDVSENWSYYSGEPDVSPDGKWLLFVTDAQVLKARLSQNGVIDTSSIVALTDRGSNFDPAWSPDGRRIAYVSNLSGDSVDFYGVCRMDTDGANKIRLPDSGGDARHPRWSPNGSTVVYHGYIGHGGAEILVTSADGAGRRLLTDDTLDDVYPDWSPDGQMVAFSRRGKSPGYVVCLVDTAGHGMEVVTTGRHPRWSPDGQCLVVDDRVEDAKGRYSTVFVVDPRSGDRRQLVWR